MAKIKSYRDGKINFGEFMAKCLSGYSPLITPELINKMLAEEYPQISDKTRCPNCDASMMEYVYHFDVLCALLLFAMGKAVRERARQGLAFTVANQVHVPSLQADLSVKCRTTISAKLGLVAKVKKTADGTPAKGIWCITERGFAALRGENVPAKVRVWRGKIEERYDEQITISGAREIHKQAVERSIARNRNPKKDHRADLADYVANEWFDLAGYAAGKLL